MFLYTVRHGDTLLRIAKRFGLSGPLLQADNPQLPEGGHLAPGSLLHLPDRAAAAKAACPTRIVEADTEYGPNELYRDLGDLTRLYPFLATGTAGWSVLGRPLPWLRYGCGPLRLHVNASFHANEWVTSLLLMTFLEDLAHAYAQRSRLRGTDAALLWRTVSLWVVPMVNPDGVRLAQEGIWPGQPLYAELRRMNRNSDLFFAWKANIRGVDLNDQFPAHWKEERERRGQEGPGPRDFPGPAPLSEPESRAIAAFTARNRFDRVVALHTQGRELYWNYRDYEPLESHAMADRIAKAAGYRAVKLEGSDAGYKDWFIQSFRKPGFTVEAGMGNNPLPLSQFAAMYDEIAPLLLETLRP
jgi:g-D-glutamyl-meso-diaminopimelate peptidase